MSRELSAADDGKRQILTWIEDDRARIVEFLSAFLRIATPNPPGETRAAKDFVASFLKQRGLDYRIVDPQPELPNIIAAFDGGAGAGRHLVLNGHMDVFPVGDGSGWTKDCWGGEVSDGCLWGRGACDMKSGTTASIFTYIYLARLRERLSGRLTLTVVSDEETFGPWGSRYLVEHHPEVLGDCCINAEPSSRHTIRFGEKGLVWLRFHVTTRGGHSAYPHTGESATKIATRLIIDLEALHNLPPAMPQNVADAIARGRAAIEAGLGAGATDVMSRITTNVGTLSGGLKINMIPDSASFDYDVRLPVGINKEQVMGKIARILSAYPEVTVEELNATAPSHCDPDHEMVGIMQRNAESVSGVMPAPIISLGGTDARLWRYAGVPAYVYGPSPASMGRPDEFVTIDDLFHVLKVHALSAWDYLRAK